MTRWWDPAPAKRRRRRGASFRDPQRRQKLLALWLYRLRFGIALTLLLASVWLVQRGWLWLLDEERFPLRYVTIHGQLRQLAPSDLQLLLGDTLGRNFFALDLVALRDKLSAEPWIKEVTIQRRWPRSLVIELVERRATAHWGDHEMLSVEGERFKPRRFRQLRPWPRLAGPDEREREVWAAYLRVNELLAPLALQAVELSQNARYAWQLELDNGIRLLLGSEAFWPRLERFIAVYPRELAPRVASVDSVDLRYLDGFAVRWRQRPSS